MRNLVYEIIVYERITRRVVMRSFVVLADKNFENF